MSNLKYTAYVRETGEVLYSGEAQHPQFLETGVVCIHIGDRFGPGWIDLSGYTPLPSRPSEHHTFNYAIKQWEDPRTLDDLRLVKRTQINKDRDAFEFGGLDWNGYRFDSNAISQQRIQGSAQMAMVAQAAGQPFSIDWTLADNSVIALDGNQMLSVGLTMGQHIASAHSKSRLLKQQIDAAQSAEELSSIVW